MAKLPKLELIPPLFRRAICFNYNQLLHFSCESADDGKNTSEYFLKDAGAQGIGSRLVADAPRTSDNASGTVHSSTQKCTAAAAPDSDVQASSVAA